MSNNKIIEEDAYYNTKQDWEILVSEGHCYKSQLNAFFEKHKGKLVLKSYIILFASIFAFGCLISSSNKISSYSLSLAGDPEHYVSIPGVKEKVSYKLASVPAIIGSAQSGITEDSLKNILNAVSADIKQYGNQYSQWTNVANLSPAPHITKVSKALNNENRAKVGEGEVILNTENTPGLPDVAVLAWVDSQLYYIAVDGTGTYKVLIGKRLEGINNVPFSGGEQTLVRLALSTETNK